MTFRPTFSEIVKPYLLKNPQETVSEEAAVAVTGGHPVRCFPYGMGCAWLGNHSDYKRTHSFAANLENDLLTLETAYQLGFRYFDTAPAYANSEFVLGEFVPSVPRGDIFLATKLELYQKPPSQTAAEFTRKSLAESLKRLKTDYLDLYQIHDIHSLVDVWGDGGALEVLRQAQQEGTIHYIGMATRWHTILEQAASSGEFDTILTYSDFTPLNQTARNTIRLAHELGVGVINASPLSFMLRKLSADHLRRYEGHPEYPLVKQISKDFDDFAALCLQQNVALLAAALHFPQTNPAIDITLTGPANVQEVQSSVEALKSVVSADLWDAWANHSVGVNTP